MDDKALMREAAREILSLRQKIEVQEAQIGVVRVFQAALLGPLPPQPMSPDIVQALMKAGSSDKPER